MQPTQTQRYGAMTRLDSRVSGVIAWVPAAGDVVVIA